LTVKENPRVLIIVFLILAATILFTPKIAPAQVPNPLAVMDKNVEAIELRDETFIDGLAKLNGQTNFGIAVELPLKERLSDTNIKYARLSSRVPRGTVREALNYLCSLDPRFAWSIYKNTINVYPRNAPEVGNKYFMNRRLSDTTLEISDPAQAIFRTIAALPGSLEQIAFSQSGALPGFPHPWNFSPEGLTLREAFDEIALHMGTGYGWTLGGANEFRVIRFHARLLPVSTSEPENQATGQEAPYIQVVSIAVEPQTIHTAYKPNRAILTAGLLVHGKISSGSTATLELATRSTDAPGLKVCLQNPTETVHLDSSFIRVEFPVEPCADTAQGMILLGVTVRSTTGQVTTKKSPSDQGQTTQLAIVVP
jgi:hypothetical protein